MQLLGEMDLVCGAETCKNFRERWLVLVPNIILLSKELMKTNKAVREVLHRYSGDGMEDFGITYYI